MQYLKTAVAVMLGLACTSSLAWAQADRFNNQILAAPTATAPQAGDSVVLVQGGVTKKLPGNIYVLLGGNYGSPSAISLGNATNLPISAISGLGSGIAAFLANPTNAVPFSWMQAQAGNTLMGNPTGVSAPPTSITLGSGLTFSGGAIVATGGGGGGITTNGANNDLLVSNGIGGFGSAITPGTGIALHLAAPISSIPATWLQSGVAVANLGFTPVNAGTLGTGVAAFLTTPVAGVPSSWLQSGVAVANLGFTPPPNTRTVTGTGMLTGGGDLTANRTITLAAAAANTVLANATSSSAVPTAAAIPSCPDIDGSHLNYTAGVGFSCGVTGDGGGAGSALDITDGTNTVPSAASLTVDPNSFEIGGTGGAASMTQVTTTLDKTTAAGSTPTVSYTMTAADSNLVVLLAAGKTYAYPTAGSAGFPAKWGNCAVNTSTSGNATVQSTTSTFNGAGNATSLLLGPGSWICPTSDGTNWPSQAGNFDNFPGALSLSGTLTPTTLSGNVDNYAPAGIGTALALRISGGAANRNITGLNAGQTDGRIMTITNIGTTNNLVLMNDVTSTAAYRFSLGANVTLPPNTALALRYDGSTLRWRPFTRALSDTGVTAAPYTCANITVGVDGRLTAASNGVCSGATGIASGFAPIGWVAGVNPNKAIILTATTGMTVTAIRGTVADAVGATATVAVYKAPTGTACSGGTLQHGAGTSFNANGTANTSPTALTLAGGAANVLAAGNYLCLVTTGGANWTEGVGIGGITVEYTTP